MRKLLKSFLKLLRIKTKRILPKEGILITVPGASFDLFSSSVHSYLGFIDLTDLHHGDEVEISEMIKPWSNTDFRIHRFQKFTGPLEIPLISFPSRTIDCPVKIVLKQNTGMRRNILFSFRYD